MMQRSFFLFLAVYLLVVFTGLLGFFWQDDRFFYLSGINFLFLLMFFIVVYFMKRKAVLPEHASDESKEDGVRYPSQFVKYPYVKQKKNKSGSGFFVFVVLILFLVSSVDMVFFNYLGDFAWIFPLLYLIVLLVFSKDLVEDKLKIFKVTFDFKFFLFLSSFVVLILVIGTLYFKYLSVSILLGLLLSFLSFFVAYLFVKNQGFRYFFGTIYSKIYFVLIVLFFGWSLVSTINMQKVNVEFSKLSQKIESLFEKKNDNPLLFDEKGELVSSGIVQYSGRGEDVIEYTGEVLVSSVNTVFVSEDLNKEEKTMKDLLMQELLIKDTDNISMIVSLKFLMEYFDINLSSYENTKFTYISQKNENYPYWKTAYDKKMIGVATNPATKISCETYQVFKGMLLGWDLKYDSSNVKKVFWRESQKRNMLNGCEYGNLLKGENL